jgi:Tfp pilus assembly protein PilX
MNRISSPRAQSGVTLVVGLIMLVLITLVVSTAFLLSTTNLRSVGNMQFRDEAIAAANQAIELVLSSPFTTDPAAAEQTINVDIDQDSTTDNDYVVSIATPICIRAVQEASTAAPSSVTFIVPASNYRTVWDIDAAVTDAASGASVRVRQAVRELLTQSQCNAVCPPGPSTVCS